MAGYISHLVRSAYDDLLAGGYLAYIYINPYDGRYWYILD